MEQANFNLKCSQRYFHFVPIISSGIGQFSKQDIWEVLGSIGKSVKNEIRNANEIEVEHRFLKSNVKFHTGVGNDKLFSVNKKGTEPYKYDCVVIEIPDLSIHLVGFPFLGLAKKFTEKLMNEKSIFKKIDFVSVDLKQFISDCKETDIFMDKFRCVVSAMHLNVHEKTNALTKLIAEGNRPLDSPMYDDWILPRLNDSSYMIGQISFATGTDIFSDSSIPKIDLTVHIDVFGNCRSYVRAGANVFFNIPLLYRVFNKQGCLHSQPSNPLSKIKNGENNG